MAAELKNSIGTHKNVRVMEAPIFLVGFPGKNGQEETKLAVIFGTEEVGYNVRFLSDATVAVDNGLQKKILVAAGLKEDSDG